MEHRVVVLRNYIRRKQIKLFKSPANSDAQSILRSYGGWGGGLTPGQRGNSQERLVLETDQKLQQDF